MLLLGCLSDGLPESQFPRPVYGGRNEPKFGEHYRYYKADERVQKYRYQYLGAGRQHQPPEVSVDVDGNIRFGLGAVKGLGDSAVDAIVKEREAHGSYKNIFDFIQRVPSGAVKRNNLESLVLSGAFDCSTHHPRTVFRRECQRGKLIDQLARYGSRYQTDKDAVQNSLFGDMDMVEIATPEVPQAEPWSSLERLNKERDLVGIYRVRPPVGRLCRHTSKCVQRAHDGFERFGTVCQYGPHAGRHGHGRTEGYLQDR